MKKNKLQIMKQSIVFFFLLKIGFLVAQTSTNSAGSGTYTNTSSWTSPSNLTGNATIGNGHTITIPANINQVYSNKINFSGNGKLVLEGSTSKWVPATSMNASPPIESLNLQTVWSASSVFVNDVYGTGHNLPWIDSGQAWSAGSQNNGTDFLQYDLRSPRWVQGIVTQGRANMAQWVTSAKVDVSVDNVNWVTAATSLNLNTDQSTKVYRNFPNVMYCRYVRVTPIGVFSYASMRLGILLRDNVFKSCNEIKTNFPNATSGTYVIDPDGSGPLASISCYCDMVTDGGGWTLVLNYLHRGGTNPELSVRTNNLPLLGSTTLGIDESSNTTTWGHTSPSYLNAFTFSELRFYGVTSAHTRVIHFKTTHANTVNYFRTGTGSMTGINTSFATLPSHSAFLPNTASSFFSNEGGLAMTNFPFWLGGTYHWGIRGGSSPNFYRWEVDDFPNSFSNNTYHQIWIR